MNFTYFKFLFINTIKRKPVWITWLLFLFTCTCFIIILPLAAKMNTLQVWANTTMAICQTFLGMTAALFTAILAINMFKDTNEEGTELIVISKPISRFKIVLTKVILFAVFCIIVNISACIITMFTAFLPRTETRFYWGLVLSMFIGNAVTFGIFGSIAILMSVKFAKVGIIITNVVLSLVFLIYQALTIFCFSIPTKALADNSMAAPSYILIDRNEDGTYTEKEVVQFVAGDLTELLEGKKISCEATNWKEMKEFWDVNILGVNPTKGLNVTDIASQVSLTYLSYGIDGYAARQAKRMFALSRFYNYELTSPASPEIIGGVENKQTLPWMYTGYFIYPVTVGETTIDIYYPSSIGYAGIKPITTTRLRGYTDKIPVGYVRSKEAMSQREVYFEKEDWDKYKLQFDEMYDRVFDYRLYINDPSELPDDVAQYDSFFAKNNTNVKKYYQIIWGTLMGSTGSVFANNDGTYKYDATSFDIKTPDDINDRFIQFKYYCYLKALKEQQDLLNKDPDQTSDPYQYEAWQQAIADHSYAASLFNVQYEHWMQKAMNDDCIIIEPNTQTVAYRIIDEAWNYERQALEAEFPSKTDQYNQAKYSAKSIMSKTAAIFNTVCSVSEKFLFDSTTTSSRNYKLTGEAHMVDDNWIPYVGSLIVPLGQNLQYFFYKTTPVVQYWHFAVIWGSISLALMTAGVIVYNKYDVK